LFIFSIIIFSVSDVASRDIKNSGDLKISEQSLFSEYAGDWVNLKYFKAAQESKSAKYSQSACEYSYVTINNDTASFAIYIHEVEQYKILKSKTSNVFCTNFNSELIHMSVSNDTLFIVKGNNRDLFVRYQMLIPNRKYFANRLLAKEIFSGDYISQSNPINNVRFNDNGTVSGLSDFKTYGVEDDYFFDGCNLDILYLQADSKDRIQYTWEFVKGKLMIYKLDCEIFDKSSSMCVKTKKGKLLFQLIKK